MRSLKRFTAELTDFGGKWIASNSREEDVQEWTIWVRHCHRHRGKASHREEGHDLHLHKLVRVPLVVVVVIRVSRYWRYQNVRSSCPTRGLIYLDGRHFKHSPVTSSTKGMVYARQTWRPCE